MKWKHEADAEPAPPAVVMMAYALISFFLLIGFLQLGVFRRLGALEVQAGEVSHRVQLEVSRQLAAKEAKALQEETWWPPSSRPTPKEVTP